MDKLNNMEYNILLKNWDFYIQNVYPQLLGIIYLNTHVDVCVNRIIQRNWNEECNVDQSYLNILYEKFKNYLMSQLFTLVIDGNYDLKRDSIKIGENIHNFIYSYQSVYVIIN